MPNDKPWVAPGLSPEDRADLAYEEWSGIYSRGGNLNLRERIQEAIEAAVQDERERCAKICDRVQMEHDEDGCTCCGPSDAADAIREMQNGNTA